jgi:protein-tyrosine phosphatase
VGNAPKPTNDCIEVSEKFDGAFRESFSRAIRAAGKKLLPKAVIQEARQYRAYNREERPIYLRLRIMNGLGLSNPKRLRPPATTRSFVFVCYGNIMRSPMCEALLNRAFSGLHDTQLMVTSAGLNAVHGGLAHPWAVTAAREWGISLESHRARLLTPEMVNQADAIFAMDYQNQVQLLSRHPHARNKVFMLSAYAGGDYRPVEIHDPYDLGPEGTYWCYEILDTCIQNLARSILHKDKNTDTIRTL